MRLLKIKFLIIIQFLALGVLAQYKTTIPLNENVRHGKLDNGMTYYVLHNEEPKERAGFYFVQNVGAILEEDSQNGLAHFLEHMAFNGTKHFEGKGILNFLEKHGVRFGADINAYTSQDQTVYNLSNVPTNEDGLLDSSLLVLHDWSGYLLLKDEEIEAERGVIREEWRTRRTSRFRLNAQTNKVLFKDSKYAVRDVIGSLDVINNFNPNELRDYYKKWYRPDLQAVVVVGDFNADEMVEKIKKRFSTIPLRENLPERKYYSIPDNEKVLYCKATDPEAKFTSVALVYKKAKPEVRDENAYKVSMMEKMYQSMIGDRFKEITQDKNSSSYGFFAGFFSFARTAKVFYLNSSPKDGKEKEAFKEMITEVERVSRFGFTKLEVNRAKMAILNEYDNFYKNRNKITHDNWARQLGNHYLEAEPVFTPKAEYDLTKKVVSEITLEEFNAWAKQQQTEKNRVILVSGPDSKKEQLPSEEDLLKVLDEVKSSNIEAYAEEEDVTPLVSAELPGSKVKSTFAVKGISNAKAVVLENGAKVVILPTEHNKDEILFHGYSYGGKSLLSIDELASADAATSIANASGLGEFDAARLKKKLTGKTVQLRPYINDNGEGFRGQSSVKDFETMLQLLYLSFEKPRFDKDRYSTTMSHWLTYAKNRMSSNADAFSDSVNMITNNHNKRVLLFNEDFVNSIDFDKAQKAYKNRFQNAADFTFVFVGNVNTDSDLKLIEKYIGSINSTGKVEEPKDHNMRPAKGENKLHFNKKMEVPKATVYASLHGKLDYNLENRIYVNVIQRLLSKRYLEEIREKEGGTYGVGVRGVLNRVPENEFMIFLKFDCDPEAQEKLLGIALNEIEEIKKGNIVSKDLNEIKQNLVKLRKEQIEENNFWLEAIVSNLKADSEFINNDEFAKLVSTISEKSVAEKAKKMFSKMSTTEVVMKPAK